MRELFDLLDTIYEKDVDLFENKYDFHDLFTNLIDGCVKSEKKKTEELSETM